jgi:oxygen-dependent protoporphyrinogen oxidase
VASALAKNPSVLRALRALLRATPPSRAPVFLAPRGGVWRMVEALASALGAAPNVDVHVNTPVGALDDLDHDAVVLAAPAPAVAQLVERPAPDAANALRAIRWSSVATITFAYADSDADAAPRSLVAEPRSARSRRQRSGGVARGTGFLVPRVEGRLITACTWLSDKWAHYARGGVALVRASCGRDGDDAVLDLADDDLVARAHDELQAAAGLRGDPKEAVVIRWRNAFPQYTPGHLARIGTIASALNELPLPVEAIGAWGSGVGIAACVEQAHAATARVLERLGTGR